MISTCSVSQFVPANSKNVFASSQKWNYRWRKMRQNMKIGSWWLMRRGAQGKPILTLSFFSSSSYFFFFFLIFLYFILQGNPPTFTFSYSFFCRVRTVEGVVTDKESVLIWLYSLKIFLFQQINLFVYLFENISIPSNKFLINNN